MAVKTLTEVKAWANSMLQDVGATRWGDTELTLHLLEALRIAAEYIPNTTRNICKIVFKTGSATSTSTGKLVDATNSQFVAADDERTVYNTSDKTVTEISSYDSESQVTLDADIFASGESYEMYCIGGSDPRDVYIGGISDIIEVLWVEYPIGEDPRKFRNFERMPNSELIRLLLDDKPTTSDHDKPVFVFCNVPHTLTDLASTLNPAMERIVVVLAAALASISKGQESIAQVQTVIATYDKVSHSILEMTTHLAKAKTDLDFGRTEVAKVPAIVTLAETAIGQIQSQLTKAIGDTDTGRPKVNAINVAGPVASTYVPLAAAALREANAYIDKAAINLRQASADESIANTYAGLASGDLNEAGVCLNRAYAYIRELEGRINIAKTSSLYVEWGERKLAMAKADLVRMRKSLRRTKHTYARD